MPVRRSASFNCVSLQVFETLDAAQSYREYCTQVIHAADFPLIQCNCRSILPCVGLHGHPQSA